MKSLPAKLPAKLSRALLGPLPVSRDRAMGISERLSAMTSLGSSLEYLAARKNIRRGGLNDWAIARDGYVRRGRVTRKVLDLLADERTTTALHAARVAASAALLLPGSGRWRGAANVFLGLSNSALYPRHRYGTDGSDQVSTLVQSATGLARLSSSPATQDALLWYVALQSNLSYLFSGWVKLIGKEWRDGSALPGVMRTRTYGQRHVWELTQKYPRSSRALAHGVLALECLFPVLYLRGGALARPVIASAAAFHVANGFVMGLGRFVTSFTAMHPMVAYTSTPASHPAVAGRDDRMPAAAALVLGGGAVAAAALAVSRRLRATDPWPGSRTVTTRHGNELCYLAQFPEGSEGPVAVFVPGLAATPEHFAWITERLYHEGRGLVTYNRAGYGPSRYRAQGPYTLRQSVDDLVDLIGAAVPADRSVLLVGHSLGGEIARRAADHLGGRLHGIVYLDSSHPAELNRSEQQDETSGALRESLATYMVSLRTGLGALLNRPDWLENLPAPVRAKVMATYADPRLWSAGMREWDATEADFRAHQGALPPIDAHALVLSAQTTVDRDPEQLLMHKELADAHQHTDRVVRSAVIEGADHDSLLTRAGLATDVGRRIVGFLDETTRPAAAAPENALEETR
ncbi:alpha/beta fold hydrolase [Streptomyces sp. TRM49041]|uniref:alpha/beta fold hydrolase n=1 Tax=Streptomyces sp. TRM49041 TaxID=2603216 RepID=UPI0021CC89F2|nr:alpha/beta fold hydrolase [Streptomyces sp. TRM49041]